MSHLRSALHASAYAIALIAGVFTFSHATDDAQAAATNVLVASTAANAAQLPDADIERELASREKRVSRSAARRDARPAPVAKRAVIEAITWTPPVSGYRITGQFGDRSSMWSSGMHTGLDFAAPSGTPIRSIAAGVVTQASYDGSYGNKTVVTLPGGGEVWYSHQDRLAVRKGQRLAVGQVLGSIGSTGNVTGAHLHMEIRYGDKPVDPHAVLAGEGVGL